jgi:NAD-dependent deacetylase
LNGYSTKQKLSVKTGQGQLEWDRKIEAPRCPHCGAWVRPDVVWFNESLPGAALERAFALSETADIMLEVGTSGVVVPAANLPFAAKLQEATIIEVNPEMTYITSIADWHLAGPSGTILPSVIAAMSSEPPNV